jgi:hypothetical protein
MLCNTSQSCYAPVVSKTSQAENWTEHKWEERGEKVRNTRASQKPPLSCILLIKSSFSQENSKKNKARERQQLLEGKGENSEKPAFHILA